MGIDFRALAAPFMVTDLEFRAGSTNGDKTKSMALAYITSRAVMNRLDEVAGPENWCDVYNAGPNGGVICGLSLRVNDEWITKWDGADNTNFEAVKGGLSDALKRAAVKWGIGRYLYNAPNLWIPCQQRGKTIVIDQRVAQDAYIKAGGEYALASQQKQTISPTDLHAPVEPPQGRPKTIKDLTADRVFARIQELTGGYYNHPAHLLHAVGDWPDFANRAAVKEFGEKAVAHAEQRRAEKAGEPEAVEAEAADATDEIPW